MRRDRHITFAMALITVCMGLLSVLLMFLNCNISAVVFAILGLILGTLTYYI